MKFKWLFLIFLVQIIRYSESKSLNVKVNVRVNGVNVFSEEESKLIQQCKKNDDETKVEQVKKSIEKSPTKAIINRKDEQATPTPKNKAAKPIITKQKTNDKAKPSPQNSKPIKKQEPKATNVNQKKDEKAKVKPTQQNLKPPQKKSSILKKPKVHPSSKPFMLFQESSSNSSGLLKSGSKVEFSKYWRYYKLQYGKKIEKKLESERRALFEKRVKHVLEFNDECKKNDSCTFTKTVYGYADIPRDEFLKKRTGLKFNQFDEALLNASDTTPRRRKRYSIDMENTVDYSSYITNVKDQAFCGCCWAASSLSAIEMNLKMQGFQTILSLQQNVDCSKEPNQACDGGLPYNLFKQLQEKNIAVSPISEYSSFTGVPDECNPDLPKVSVNEEGWGWKITGQYFKYPATEADLEMALRTYGVCTVGIDLNNDVQMYKSGILDSPTCTGEPAHAVTVIGYGVSKDDSKNKKGSGNKDDSKGKKLSGSKDDKKDKKGSGSKDDKKDKEIIPHWHILNSWGSDWGENGTFRMIRGKNMCNVGKIISCPIVEFFEDS